MPDLLLRLCALSLLVLVTALPVVSSGVAAPDTPLPHDPAIVYGTLANGMRYWIRPGAPPTGKVTLWLRIGSGSLNEEDGERGLAHFLEHMLFKGTAKVGPEEYTRMIAKNGGKSNAFTTLDHTVYFATMSKEKIGIEIDMEADRMVNALLNGNYFEPEKKVIMEERRLRTDDNPIAALSEVAAATAYQTHP